jgi:predicted nucleotidyltransferase
MPQPPIDEFVARAATSLRAEGASAVYVFGSRAMGASHAASDIDLAVEGLAPSRFFRALARACDAAGHEIDLIDLDEDNPFTRHLRRAGVLRRVA